MVKMACERELWSFMWVLAVLRWWLPGVVDSFGGNVEVVVALRLWW